MLARYSLIVVALTIVCGCSDLYFRPQQPESGNAQKEGKVNSLDRPFMEHPSGEFDSAVGAMADAIKRLRALPEWNKWITFSAQGMGNRIDSYHFAAIRMRKDELRFENPIDLDTELITKRASVPQLCLIKSGEAYSVANATPVQAARVMDTIYRHYLGIRPHTGEGDDYAIGAEW